MPRARLDVETGQAQMYGALAGLGGALFDIGQKIEKAENAMELSTFQRKADEIWNAAYNSMLTTTEPEARLNLYQTAINDASILKSKKQKVNDAYQIYLNDLIPRWQARFNDIDRTLRIKNAKDQLELNGQAALEAGDLQKYHKDLNLALSTGLITQVEFDYKTKNAPIDSILAQSRILIGNNNPQAAITMLEGLKGLSGEQLDYRDRLLRMAQQQAVINTDEIQNEIVFGMFENRDKTLAEKAILGEQYINKLKTTPGLSAENARVMVNRVEEWMAGKERINDSLVYTKLFRDVTQLHRGIGRAEEIRRSVVAAYPNLDDQHFESLNKYLDETVEGWNADTLRRLEKEAIPHLAPRLSMLERFIEMSAMPGISIGEKAKYDSLIERLREPAKIDADRLALYLNQCRKWIAANPTAPNFYENGRVILSQFEKYTDNQIQQMEKQLEKEALIVSPVPTPEELRRQNTKEAYQKGIELGYWTK